MPIAGRGRLSTGWVIQGAFRGRVDEGAAVGQTRRRPVLRVRDAGQGIGSVAAGELAVRGGVAKGSTVQLHDGGVRRTSVHWSGGQVLAANDPARDLLRRGNGLHDKGGTLHAWLPADNTRLLKPLGTAPAVVVGRSASDGSMIVHGAPGGMRLGLHIFPMGEAQADFGGRRVVALLAEGRSVHDIATATAYQQSYVRWLLKQIFQKQRVSGQVALVWWVLAADALPRC